MSDANQFKIILLSNEERQQKRFKDIFEKVGVDAIFTQDLDQFWHMANVEDVDLCLVDVRQMSSGNRTLKNHPRVVNNELPLAFFYATGSQALVYSTYDFNHYGLINSAMSLAGQLKSILLRVEKTQGVQNTIKSLEYDKLMAEKSKRKFVEENEKLKQGVFYHGMLETVSEQMKGLWKDVDFYQGVGHFFQSINFIKRFSFFLLNNSGNKLISPTFDQDKYEKLPSIWMDQNCPNGIHMVGQNKANQIAIDLWGAQFVQVHFFDAYDNPIAIGLLEVEEEFVEKFNWIEFENRLNSQFSRHLLNRKLNNLSIDSELNSFEFFEFIRKKNANLNRENRILKELSFKQIFVKAFSKDEGASRTSSVDFSWISFYQEYFRPLVANFNFDYKVCYFSGDKVFFCIPEEEAETFEYELKAYNKRFPFWRYFEAADKMVLSDLSPELRSRPFSLYGMSSLFIAEKTSGKTTGKITEITADKTQEMQKLGQGKSSRGEFRSRPPMTM